MSRFNHPEMGFIIMTIQIKVRFGHFLKVTKYESMKNESLSLILSAISLTGELKHSHWQLLVLFYGNCYFLKSIITYRLIWQGFAGSDSPWNKWSWANTEYPASTIECALLVSISFYVLRDFSCVNLKIMEHSYIVNKASVKSIWMRKENDCSGIIMSPFSPSQPLSVFICPIIHF